MPATKRSKRLEAEPERIWRLVADPYGLPRWWPRVTRVESVDIKPGVKRSRWTTVLGTKEGRGVRADYRCVDATEGRRIVWEQELEGTPFERHLVSSRTELLIKPVGDDRSQVTIRVDQRLRGVSKLGGPMMRGAMRRLADDALIGLEQALGGKPK